MPALSHSLFVLVPFFHGLRAMKNFMFVQWLASDSLNVTFHFDLSGYLKSHLPSNPVVYSARVTG
jgi:hypothetical protein